MLVSGANNTLLAEYSGLHRRAKNDQQIVIRKQYIYDIAFEQLRENIYRGKLKPGEKIIPERKLAELMQISRSSVRKAINMLLEKGYIEHRMGKGYFVTMPDVQDQHNPFSSIMTPRKSSLDELMEVRIGLETHGVALAAERASDRDILYLQQSLSELTEGQPNREKARNADAKFHMGIAFATHNTVHIDLTRRFYDYMFHSISKLQALLYEKHSNLEIIDKQHFKICDAIASRDIQSAKRYMLQHITFLRGFLGNSGAVAQ